MCAWVCALLLAAGGLPPFAAEVHAFNIDAATPSAAIHTFAAQSGVEILVAGDRLAGKRLNAVSGNFPTDIALQKLLEGSGLQYRYVGERAIALIAEPRHRNRGERADLLGSRAPSLSAFGLDTITVTARKRAENLQDTPISVSAFSGDALDRRQIFSTANLGQITPNLQLATLAPLSGNNSAAQVFIRGIGQTDATAGVDPGVGIYIDDVYMGSAVGGVMDFRDIASVQVLRGPQGTLFGRNTIGGAILLTTIPPGDELGGTLRAGVGTDQLLEGFAALNLPMSETLKTRFTAGKRSRYGYVTRAFDGLDLGNVNSYALTAKALWEPVNTFRLNLKADYTHANEHGTPLVFAAINESAAFPSIVSAAAGCPNITVDDPRCANDFWNDGPYTANGTLPLQSALESWGLTASAEVGVNDRLSFKSITAYRELDWKGIRDADNTPFMILHTKYVSSGEQLSQELHALASLGRLNGVLGLFYFNQSTDDRLRVSFPPETEDSNDNLINNNSWAAFSQWSYAFTDALSLSGGLRYTYEKKASTPFQFNFDNPAVLYVPHQRYEKSFNATTGSVSVQYRWNPSVMTYLSWTQGFKSGGFNSRFNAVVPAGAPPPFNPEKADATELGVKLYVSNRLRVNAALFTTSYDDLQLTYRIGTAPFIFNAGKASIDGLDLELEYLPMRGLMLAAGLGVLNAEIDRVSTIVGATTAVTTNSQLPYSPQLQGNASISYSLPITSRLQATPRVDVSHTGAQFFDSGNTREIAQNNAVTVLNLGLSVDNEIGGWQFALGVSNATNETYPVAGNSSLTTKSGYAEIAYSRGREAFLNVTKTF